MTIRRLPPVAPDVARWVRDAATSVNQLADRVEKPQTGQTRYDGTNLQWWDGTAWVNV